jgi:hypothetical protein
VSIAFQSQAKALKLVAGASKMRTTFVFIGNREPAEYTGSFPSQT